MMAGGACKGKCHPAFIFFFAASPPLLATHEVCSVAACAPSVWDQHQAMDAHPWPMGPWLDCTEFPPLQLVNSQCVAPVRLPAAIVSPVARSQGGLLLSCHLIPIPTAALPPTLSLAVILLTGPLPPRPAPSFLLAPSAFSFSLSFNTLVSVFVSKLNSNFNSRPPTPSRPCLVCLYQLVQHHLNIIASSSVFRLRPAFSRLRSRNRWLAPVCVLSVCTFVLSPTFPREALRPSDSEPPVLGL